MYYQILDTNELTIRRFLTEDAAYHYLCTVAQDEGVERIRDYVLYGCRGSTRAIIYREAALAQIIANMMEGTCGR